MQVTTVMVVMLIAWSLYTIVTKGFHPVPVPVSQNFHFSDSALGWLKGSNLPRITVFAILIGLGHSVLALSGEETLAQVYREIAAPKRKNLLKTGFIVFLYSLLFTSLVSFFAVMLIPDAQRPQYLDNLIGGLSMFLAGPFAARLAFHVFVVLVGVLILSGAVNTSIIGSNGVLSRVAEDGVLPPWFREPHTKHGTTHRIVNLIVGLQLITILLSRGNVDMLGEAYAFGVVWSFSIERAPRWSCFAFNILKPNGGNFPSIFTSVDGKIPIGLMTATAMLFLMAIMNLFTKSTATIAGGIFTVIFFTLFTLSERKYAKDQSASRIRSNPDGADPFRETSRERFRLEKGVALGPASLNLYRGCRVVAVKRANDLRALEKVLSVESTDQENVLVVSVDFRSSDGW